MPGGGRGLCTERYDDGLHAAETQSDGLSCSRCWPAAASVGGNRHARQVVGRKEEFPALLYAVLGGSTRISLSRAPTGKTLSQRWIKRAPKISKTQAL